MKDKINNAISHGLQCLVMGFLGAGLFGYCLNAFGLTLVGLVGGFVGSIYNFNKFISEENEARLARLAETNRQPVFSAKRTRSHSHSQRL